MNPFLRSRPSLAVDCPFCLGLDIVVCVLQRFYAADPIAIVGILIESQQFLGLLILSSDLVERVVG